MALMLHYWNSTTERFGLILEDGAVAEFKNQSQTPGKTLLVDRQSIEPFLPMAVASWHTHPENSVNLSCHDYAMFLTMPSLTHYIITETRIRSFVVSNGKVMLHEADCI